MANGAGVLRILFKVSQDAQKTGTPWQDAVIAHAQLLDEVGIGDHFPHLEPGTMQAQVRRVADLTGEEEETVERVQSAMYSYLKMVIETTQEVARRKRQNSSTTEGNGPDVRA